jgi:hypothetical protein
MEECNSYTNPTLYFFQDVFFEAGFYNVFNSMGFLLCEFLKKCFIGQSYAPFYERQRQPFEIFSQQNPQAYHGQQWDQLKKLKHL